ncbi:MAG: two-component sensor histidine kinase [Odoribacter sp. 43_10]|nr:MAG: two-component sensor histidine kinase [Odoribacter sp. 43_10]
MPFTANDYEKLHQLMNSSPEIRELLQKLLDSQQYTISKISHEVRNPLTLIYSTFQLIESSHPETRDFSHWSELREDIEYTISLLQELSAYNNSLGQICLSFAASCVDTDIGFSSLIAPDLPSLTADRLKLHEAILNLLRNAREAISSAGSIRLEAVLKNQMLQITISDTGCGISPEYLDTIFDPFVTYKPDGTGLGLAIVNRTITAHAGTVTVTSSCGKGTSFLLLLPIT